METEVIKVVAYIRESTISQSYNGFRPEAQIENINNYCKRHNFEVVKFFEDSGSGGNIKKRPEFSRMIDYVKNNNDIKFIVIAEVSRFFRNFLETLNFEEMLEKEHGIYAIDIWVDHDPRSYLNGGSISPAQWASRMDARVKAEQGRQYIQVTVKEGYKKKASNGFYVGMLVYGLMWTDEHKKYVKYHPDQSKLVKEIFQMYLTGQYGFTKLARYLNKSGFTQESIKREVRHIGESKVLDRTKVNKPFTLEVVRGILKNKVFIGRQNSEPFLPLKTLENNESSNLKPLISEDLFNRVQEMIKQNRSGKPAVSNNTSRQHRTYLLQGIGYSGVNGSKLHAQTDSSGKTPCRRYFPSTNKDGSQKVIPSIRADEVEGKIIELLKSVKIRSIEQIEKILREILEIEASNLTGKPQSPEITSLKKAIKALHELQKASFTYQSDETIKRLENQLLEQTAKQSPTIDEMKYFDLIELKNVLTDIAGSFTRLQNLAGQKELLNILFEKLLIGEGYIDPDYSPLNDYYFNHKIGVTEKYSEAKELKGLIQKFVPYLFEQIYIEKKLEIINITFKPTGLFLLLNDTDKIDQPIVAINPAPTPVEPTPNLNGGSWFESFSVHHIDIM